MNILIALRLICALPLLTLMGSAACAEYVVQSNAESTLNITIKPKEFVARGQHAYSIPLEVSSPAGALAFRVGIQSNAGQLGGWRVLFENSMTGTTEDKLEGNVLSDGREHLTKYFFSNDIHLVLSGEDRSNIPDFITITRTIAIKPSVSGPLSAGWPLLNYDDPAVSPEQREKARSVALITFGNGAACTSFLVAKGVLVTNAHCVDSSIDFSKGAGQCGDAIILFDFNYKDATGGQTTPIQARCLTAARDTTADLGVVVFDDSVENGTARPILRISKISPGPGDKLYTIGHPLGLPTTFTRECGIKHIQDGVGEHDCPTFPGSSGTPILNSVGEVVAVTYHGDISDYTLTVLDLEAAVSKGIFYTSKAIIAASSVFLNSEAKQ
jgi:S1-C subfamily serine protease